MRYFRHEAKSSQINLYPFVCWHLGAEQSDEKFIKEMIARVKDDSTARVVLMGDGGECATKLSKGDVYTQTMSPGEQVKSLVSLLDPISDKILFAINGNHGHRIYKETGMEFDEMVALGLRVPYFGVSALWHLKVKRNVYSIYTHHGKDSGVGMASKINAAQAANKFVSADAVLTAHSHIALELPPHYRVELLDRATNTPIVWRTQHEYVCGCAYDSRSGYAEEKMYPPILPAHLKISFSGKDEEKNQSVEVFRGSV